MPSGTPGNAIASPLKSSMADTKPANTPLQLSRPVQGLGRALLDWPRQIQVTGPDPSFAFSEPAWRPLIISTLTFGAFDLTPSCKEAVSFAPRLLLGHLAKRLTSFSSFNVQPSNSTIVIRKPHGCCQARQTVSRHTARCRLVFGKPIVVSLPSEQPRFS